MNKKKKVLLIGWDAADWKAINPLMDAGYMPALEKLVNNGSIGNLSTLDPPLSPTLWTSISTGKRPYKHGILGFTEPDPTGTKVRPIHITSRKVRAIWNILSHEEYKCHQVGWWPSHPAEPINGISISNFYQRANSPITEPWPMLEGTVHPREKEDIFAALRLHPQELTGAHLLPFLPNGAEMDQNDPKIQRRIGSLQKIIADCTTIHSAATFILENEEWDFMTVYYDAIDHFGHGFMKFHPPRRPNIDEKEYEYYKDVVAAGYRYHDMMLDTLINMVPEDTLIMLISDHGFHPDHLRPKAIPREPAGPAYEHSPYGIFVAKGPGIRKDNIVYGASLIDITPTLLSYLDLPIGKDMDGKVINSMYDKWKKIETIPSWEDVEGNFYTHPEDFEEDPEVSKEALQQLIDLGYIAAPGPNEEQNIQQTIDQLDFFKARSYMDGGVYSEAIILLEKLHKSNPSQLHYSIRLANCYLITNKTAKARKVVQSIREVQGKDTISLLSLQARVCLQEENIPKAKQYINEALLIQDDFPGLKYYLGNVMMKEGLMEEAEKAYCEAIELDSEDQMAIFALGKLYYKKGDFQKSAEYCLQAVGLKFFSPTIHFQLGMALEALGEYEGAAKAYNNCAHMMPRNLSARKKLLRIYQEELNLPQLAAKVQASLPNYEFPEIVIVSGLPRSGTSMMMQMLEAGGMECFTDGKREADENNSKGYYEHEMIKFLPKDQSILKEIGDKVVKIVAPLLFHLPANYRYKIIFMERELGEILLSQHKMLQRNNVKNKGEVFSFKLWQKFEEILNNVKDKFKDRPNFEFMYVDHQEILTDPLSNARSITEFLERDLDIRAMSEVVDPALYREREKINNPIEINQ